MRRRDFLASSAAAAALAPGVARSASHQHGPGYASPTEAMRAPREKLLYVIGLYVGTGIEKPDYLATVDVDPDSPRYGQVIHRLPMSTVGDELHHFGWNACSSCHGDETCERRYLILPGLRSSRLHIIDAADAAAPRLHKTVEPEVIARRANLSAPHTVHCLASGEIMISMLGDAAGNGPGGFLLLDDKFDVIGRWEHDATGMQFNYDFWYQPRRNCMVSSEWAAPTTFMAGFDPALVAQGRYGRRLHFWDWKERRISQTVDLGENGLIPLEVRFQHNPDSKEGFVGAALSSAIWHWQRDADAWKAERVVQVESVPQEGWPFPVPGLITDVVLSMDDRFLYFSNWLHGDIRQYDVSNPAKPRLTGQVWLGGVLGHAPSLAARTWAGGPQMLQLSLDGRRLYVTNSLFSSWDNQFYPGMKTTGSYLAQVDCDTEKGGMSVNERLFVDFGKEPQGPSRAHEMRYPGGDCTSDIFV